MSELKTKETDHNLEEFVAAIENEQQQKETKELIQLFQEESGFEAKIWGKSIIGFGQYHYKYPSGHEGDAALVSFAPRKGKFTLYLWLDEARKEALLGELGKHKTGKGCIYVNKLADIDLDVLRKLVRDSKAHLQEEFGE